MGFTSPLTWTDDQLVTPTQMNTHVRDNMRWLGGEGFGTSLPSYRIEGDAFVLTDSLTLPTYLFNLRFFGTRWRWLCHGGVPIVSYLDPNVGTTIAQYQTMWSQTLSLPFAGEWKVTISARAVPAGSYAAGGAVSYAIGATAASDAWATTAYCPDSGKVGAGTRVMRHTIATAPTTLTVQCCSTTGGSYPLWRDVEIQAIPTELYVV